MGLVRIIGIVYVIYSVDYCRVVVIVFSFLYVIGVVGGFVGFSFGRVAFKSYDG